MATLLTLVKAILLYMHPQVSDAVTDRSEIVKTIRKSRLAKLKSAEATPKRKSYKKWTPRLNACSLKMLCKLIKHMLIHRTIDTNILAMVFGDNFNSSVRSLNRFLKRHIFNTEAIGRAIVSLLPEDMDIILSIDATSWEHGSTKHYLLVVGIYIEGIAIPITYNYYSDTEKTSFVEEFDVLEKVLEIVPSKKIHCILGDREFGNQKLIKWLEMNGIPYALRIRGNLLVKAEDNTICRVSKLFEDLTIGEQRRIEQLLFVKLNIRCNIYGAVGEDRNDEPSLIIVASPINFDATVLLYRKRWALEVSFKYWKSNGFNIEKTYLTGQSFENMMNIVMIVFGAIIINGYRISLKKPIPKMKLKNKKGVVKQVPRFSLFLCGIADLIKDLHHDSKIDDMIKILI